MNEKDEYAVVTKEMPFDQLLTLFKSSLGMTQYMNNGARLHKPIIEKIIDTQDVVVIHAIVAELAVIYLAIKPNCILPSEVNLLGQLSNTNKLDRIHDLCRNYLHSN